MSSETAAVDIVKLDYPVQPQIRFGWHKPVHWQLFQKLSLGNANYISIWRDMRRFAEYFIRIGLEDETPKEPRWRNEWIPPLDAMTLYAFVAQKSPRKYVEIGSGNSTKFVGRSVRDHGLETEIISIDPHPRAEIDLLCTQVIRSPLEATDLSIFAGLTEGDILFFDGSHRSFQNSDVTVFFLEVIPNLRPGILIGLHDIFLPHDYPADWYHRFYNEQYLLACWLLGGEKITTYLPVYYSTRVREIAESIAPLFDGGPLNQLERVGACFWFNIRY